MKKVLLNTILVAAMLSAAGCSTDGADGTMGAGSGRGGSMARFAISGDHLYAVSGDELRVLDISDPAELYCIDQEPIGGDAETIFVSDDRLFIGSRSCMYIFDIAVPGSPAFKSCASHFVSCDPVVASGNHAYVTLSSDNWQCPRGDNVLLVYDVSDYEHPMQVKRIEMPNPKGLGIDSAMELLFVCCRNGVRIFDIAEPASPQLVGDLTHIRELAGVGAWDVIPMDGILLVTGSGGIYQVDYTGEKAELLSVINTNKR